MKPVFTEKCFYILPSFVSNIHTHIRFGGSSLFLLYAYPLALNHYASYLSVGSDWDVDFSWYFSIRFHQEGSITHDLASLTGLQSEMKLRHTHLLWKAKDH